MKVLVVGNGGREHAFTWKLAQSDRVREIFIAPGNAGTAAEPKSTNVPIEPEDVGRLLRFALDEKVDLTVVGPEVPLVLGIVDAFEAEGLDCVGPGRDAAQLEGSKAFTKNFLQRHGIPTADYAEFTDYQEAESYIHRIGAPIVVKADGLAAGKGVILAQTVDQALTAASNMLRDGQFGSAGERIVVEEFLTGEEASYICVVDGRHILPMASSQDHKARDNGDRGPNTGGMGAYSPAPVLTPQIEQRVLERVIRPTVDGLAQDGMPYRGFLYAGLMIDRAGNPKVLEYNCRFGDPETQPILMRLKSDLLDLCQGTLQGDLDQRKALWDPRPTLGIVMAAGGYPMAYDRGDSITGLSEADSALVKVFHAGTRLGIDGGVETAGGRVLCVTAFGDSVGEAQRNAYTAAARIHWNKAYYRTDIGYRAVAREHSTSQEN